jgi:hypothetical protein
MRSVKKAKSGTETPEPSTDGAVEAFINVCNALAGLKHEEKRRVLNAVAALHGLADGPDL